jgi:hypothetical protein
MIKGMVHGGQQPVVGAHVYLMAANTTAYGAASNSLLVASSTGQGDSIGGYVLTSSNGNFSISGDYTCTAGTEVYLYALGGNPGAGANSAAGFLAVLGQCPASGSFATSVPFIYMNEVSTVAAAYAMSGFATDALHVSSSSTALSQTGMANAFGNAANLAAISTGAAYTATPLGNGAVPQSTINTIANILASCVNSNGPTSTPCATLFGNAKSGGSTGTTPTDTASAAINIAHNPGANVAALFGIATPAAAFSPALTSAPNDYTIGIVFSGAGATGAGIDSPIALAIDASGDVWITNGGSFPTVLPSISKLSANGTPLSPATGFTAGSQGLPLSIAIDSSANAWVADEVTNNLTEYSTVGAPISPAGGYTGGGLTSGASPSGVAIYGSNFVLVANLGNSSVAAFNGAGVAQSPSTGFTAGGISKPTALAVNGNAQIWIANQGSGSGASVSKIGPTGLAISPSTGYIGGGLNNPQSIAIDSSDDAWIANYGNSSLSEFNTAGTALSPSGGYTGGGLSRPLSLVLDGTANVWVANAGAGTSSVSEFSPAGVALSPATTGLASQYLNGANGIAADGAGNLWITNSNASSVTQLIGISVPVVTPLSTAVTTGGVAKRP